MNDIKYLLFVLLVFNFNNCTINHTNLLLNSKQDLNGIWQLIEEKTDKKIKYDKTEFLEEITIKITDDTVNIDVINFRGIGVGKSNYRFLGFDPITYKEEIQGNICDCSFYADLSDHSTWLETCEGSMVKYKVSMKKDFLIMEEIGGKERILKYAQNVNSI